MGGKSFLCRKDSWGLIDEADKAKMRQMKQESDLADLCADKNVNLNILYLFQTDNLTTHSQMVQWAEAWRLFCPQNAGSNTPDMCNVLCNVLHFVQLLNPYNMNKYLQRDRVFLNPHNRFYGTTQ